MTLNCPERFNMSRDSLEKTLIAIVAALIGLICGALFKFIGVAGSNWSDGYNAGWSDAYTGECTTDLQCWLVNPDVQGYGTDKFVENQ